MELTIHDEANAAVKAGDQGRPELRRVLEFCDSKPNTPMVETVPFASSIIEKSNICAVRRTTRRLAEAFPILHDLIAGYRSLLPRCDKMREEKANLRASML